MTSKLHEAARAYAVAGRKIFPCRPDSKFPATEHGFHDASSDLAQIDKWWDAEPEYNIAWQPQQEGLCCIDIDGADGETSFEDLQIEQGFLPDTYEITTPRGGRHLYFRGNLPPTQSKLAPHVDTRGGGSYALLAPSRHSGREYAVTSDKPCAVLPEWPGRLISERSKVKAQASFDGLDEPGNISRAKARLRDMVKAGKVAIEGEMGDTLTFATACDMLNLGLSEDVAFEVMDALWNPACQPPWEEDELRAKIANAAAYAENEQGAWAVPPVQDAFAEALGKLTDDDIAPPEPEDPLFRLWTLEEMDAMPEPTWLLPEAIQEGGTVLLYGPPKSFKTYAALDMSLTIASGLEGYGRPACEPQEVFYVAGEAAKDVQLRVKAWCLAKGVDYRAVKLRIFPIMPPLVVDPEKRDRFIKALIAFGKRPALIVLDTVAKAMRGLNENDAKDAGAFVDVVDGLKRVFDAAILAIHHSGKDEDGPRGSIVFVADFDTVHKVSREGTADRPMISVMNIAQRTAAERDRPWRYEGASLTGELVFTPMDDATYYRRKAEADPFAPAKIGAILSRVPSCNTHVLAHELVGQFEDEDMREKAVSAAARKLGRLAGSSLAGYCKGTGANALWSLPVAQNV